jgi:uncharacterized protein YlxW (UPF0749 family)
LSDQWLQIWLTALTLFGGLLTTYVATSGSRKEKKLEAQAAQRKAEMEAKDRARAAEMAHEASLIEQLQEEVKSLRESRVQDQKVIRQLFDEFNQLKAVQMESNIGIKILLNQIVEAGDTPRWIPPTPI